MVIYLNEFNINLDFVYILNCDLDWWNWILFFIEILFFKSVIVIVENGVREVLLLLLRLY